MIRGNSALIALLVTWFAVTSARAAEPSIPDIKTLEELRATPPLRLPDGRAARVGLAESGPDGGPWMLLYCLADARADREEAEQDQTRGDHALGPFCWRVG